jgi:protein-tyrosine phosphatase
MLDINEKTAHEIIQNLWVGNYLSAKDPEFIQSQNIKYIINLTENYPNYFSNITYLNIPIVDDELNIKESNYLFEITNRFIYEALKNDEGVLVHCYAGHHRSASVVLSFLLKYLAIPFETGIKYIRSIRPTTLRRKTRMVISVYKYYKYITQDPSVYEKVHPY